MEEAPQVSIPRDPSSLDAPKIKQLYDGGTQHLKSKVSYIWPDGGDENEEHNTRREKWSVATWSSKISRSQVVKHGSQADQSHLAAATRHNELHSHRPRKKRKVTRQGFQNQHDEEEVDKALRGMIRGLGAATRERAEIDIREVRREAAARGGGLGADSTQERAARGRGASTSTNADTRRQVAHTEEDEDAFENAFRDVRLVNDTMTPRQAQRDQEFKEEADKEIEDGRQAAASHRQAVGDGVATDGSVLFVRHSTGLRRNYGDNSNVGRQLYRKVLDQSAQKQPAQKQPARKQPAQKKPARKKPAPPTAKKKPPPAAKQPPPTTTCAVEGCTLGDTTIVADHKCYNKCGRVFHNLCAQMKHLCDDENELDMYSIVLWDVNVL